MKQKLSIIGIDDIANYANQDDVDSIQAGIQYLQENPEAFLVIANEGGSKTLLPFLQQTLQFHHIHINLHSKSTTSRLAELGNWDITGTFPMEQVHFNRLYHQIKETYGSDEQEDDYLRCSRVTDLLKNFYDCMPEPEVDLILRMNSEPVQNTSKGLNLCLAFYPDPKKLADQDQYMETGLANGQKEQSYYYN